jgi:hypothetical protein
MTGTDGRILPFVVPVTSEVKRPDTTEVKAPQNNDFFELGSLKQKLFWRPVKFSRKLHYPKVVPDGCAWKADGGGFALSRQKPTKYLGYYRREIIDNLEKQYGKKTARRRKN